MNIVGIEIITNTATFRNPEFQNFHKTLPLPPPTTIIGLAGAALGFSPKATQDFFIENKFKFGVFGKSLGKAKDLWKYHKPTKGTESYNYYPELGSVIIKEILFTNVFIIAYGSENTDVIKQLLYAFKSPKFALTLGNSDSLAFVKNILTLDKISKNNKIKNCIIEGNVIDKVLNNPNKDLEFSIYQTSEPIAYDLPVRFNYESDYGKRTVSEVGIFSFVAKEMMLNYDVFGVDYKNIFIPICDL